MYSETLWPGQLAAFAGLRALRHLDLQLVGRREVFRRHAEARRGDLLDLRAQAVARLERNVVLDGAFADDRRKRVAGLHGALAGAHLGAIAHRVLAAFAGIRFAADAVHRDRKRGVRLGGNRAEAHRAGREALDDFLCRLDLIDRDRRALARFELEQAAQRLELAALLVDERRVFPVRGMRIGARRVLQLRDRLRRPHVLLAADAVHVVAALVERLLEQRIVAEREPVQSRGLGRDFEQSDALDGARRAGEILVDERLLQADRLEDLRAAVRLVRRDAHLRHHLVEALADRLDVVLLRFLRVDLRYAMRDMSASVSSARYGWIASAP